MKGNSEAASMDLISQVHELERLGRVVRWEVEVDGRITYLSESSEYVFGYPPGELVGKKYFYDLYPDDRREELKAHTLHTFEKGEAFVNFRNPIVCKNGKTIWVETNGTPFHRDGEIAGYRGTDRDVTDQQKLEDNFREQKAYLDSILQTVPVAITTVDADSGAIHFANAAAISILGLNKEDSGKYKFDGAEWNIESFQGAPIPREQLPFSVVMETGKSVYGMRHAIRSKNGTRKLLEINGTPIRDENGRIKSVIFAVNDISLAESAAESKSRFLSNISHELRTPLNGIVGMTELLQMMTEGDEAQECLATMKKSAYLLTKLIDELLALADSDVYDFPIGKTEFDLKELLNKAAQKYAVAANEKGIDIKQKIEAKLPDKAYGPGECLSRIIEIILHNAVRFTPRGSIEIEAKLADENKDAFGLLVMVTDSGIGIPPEMHEIIFEGFTQVDASMSRTHDGAGIGLTLAKRLSRQIGAKISVESPVNLPRESTNPDESNTFPGSRFIIELVLDKSEASDEPA